MTLLSSFPCRKWRRPPKSSSRCYMTSAAFGSISGHASKRHFQKALSRNIPRCFGMGTSALPKHQNPSSFGSWICPRKNFKPWVSRVSRETRQTFPFEFFRGQIHRPKRNHIAKMKLTANLWLVFPETRRHFQNMGKPITLATWISIFSHDWFLPNPRFCDGFSQKPVTFWSWNWAPECDLFWGKFWYFHFQLEFGINFAGRSQDSWFRFDFDYACSPRVQLWPGAFCVGGRAYPGIT